MKTFPPWRKFPPTTLKTFFLCFVHRSVHQNFLNMTYLGRKVKKVERHKQCIEYHEHTHTHTQSYSKVPENIHFYPLILTHPGIYRHYLTHSHTHKLSNTPLLTQNSIMQQLRKTHLYYAIYFKYSLMLKPS